MLVHKKVDLNLPTNELRYGTVPFLLNASKIVDSDLTLLRVAGGMLAHPFFQAVPIKNVWL
jgi:hypothetical protein